MKKTMEKFDADGNAYRIEMSVDESAPVSFTPTEQLQDLLDGKAQCAICGDRLAYLLPIDEKDELHALVALKTFRSSDLDVDAYAIDSLLSVDSVGLTTVGFYNKATEDLFVTNVPYISDLFNETDGLLVRYDKNRLDVARERIADLLLDRIVEQRSDLEEHGLRYMQPLDLKDQEQGCLDQLSYMMFEQGVNDANDLDLSFALNADADVVMSDDRLLSGDVLSALMRNDMDLAADHVFTGLAAAAGRQMAHLKYERTYLEEHANELTERFGWRVDLTGAIKETDARTVTLQVKGCEAFTEVKVDADSLMRRMPTEKGYDFWEELHKAGCSYSEIARMPTPEIVSASYRGKEIWNRESPAIPAPDKHPAPVLSTSLKGECADARAASAQLAKDTVSRIAAQER